MKGQLSIEAIAYIAIFLAILFLFIKGETEILRDARAARDMLEAKACAERAALFVDFYGIDGKLARYEKTFGNVRASEGFVECEANGNSARARTLHEVYWSGGVLIVNASKKYPI